MLCNTSGANQVDVPSLQLPCVRDSWQPGHLQARWAMKKIPGCLEYIGDYTTQLYREYFINHETKGTRNSTTSMSWKVSGQFFFFGWETCSNSNLAWICLRVVKHWWVLITAQVVKHPKVQATHLGIVFTWICFSWWFFYRSCHGIHHHCSPPFGRCVFWYYFHPHRRIANPRIRKSGEFDGLQPRFVDFKGWNQTFL